MQGEVFSNNNLRRVDYDQGQCHGDQYRFDVITTLIKTIRHQ